MPLIGIPISHFEASELGSKYTLTLCTFVLSPGVLANVASSVLGEEYHHQALLSYLN
jgi:hypothetical protein